MPALAPARSHEVQTTLEWGLDIRLVPTCAWFDPQCDEQAIWAHLNLCCGLVAQFCEAHKVELQAWFDQPENVRDPVQCTRCKTVNPDHDWRPL